jgi:hypothetical protein
MFYGVHFKTIWVLRLNFLVVVSLFLQYNIFFVDL